MAQNYEYLGYALPTGTSDEYATNALLILAKIEKQFPEFYDSFRCPSEILTLSGARAFDTYYELGEGISAQKITDLKKLLLSHGIVLLMEAFPFGNEPELETDNRYSLVHVEAFYDMPNRYHHMPKPGWDKPNFTKLTNDNDFFLWWGNWQRSILLVPELDATIKDLLAISSWTAHDLTFGMLLGYPGEAIISFGFETEAISDAGQNRNAKIKHAEKFDGAHPVYGYLDVVENHPNIIGHEKLWSDILEKVYSKLEK